MSKYPDLMKLKNTSDDEFNKILINPMKSKEFKRKEDVTLEKVVRDMTNVLCNLTDSITLGKNPKKTISPEINIEKELEKNYKKQELIYKRKADEEEKRKADEEEKRNAGKANNKEKQSKKQSGQLKLNEENNNRNKTISSDRYNTSQVKLINANNKLPKIINKSVKSNSSNNQSKINPASINNQLPLIKVQPSSKSIKPISNALNVVKRPEKTELQKRRHLSPLSRENYNPLGLIRDEVDKAIKQKKTFTIRGSFGVVRRALLSRGWVEKFHTTYRQRLNQELKKYQQYTVPELVDMLRNKELAGLIKKIIKSKLLKDNQVDFYWDTRFDAFKECPDKIKLTLINKFRRESSSYTSKQGLCQTSREAHWFHIPGIAKINHPRCYTLTKGGDTRYFLNDFGLTASTALLKWVVRNNDTGGSKIVSNTGKIPMKTFDFAIAECYKFIKKHKHQDIDEVIRDALEVEWKEFLEQFHKAVHVGHHFKLSDKVPDEYAEAQNMVRKSTYLLNQLREYMPCMDMDGHMNIWILKPINSSRGEGIHICRTLELILEVLRKNPTRRYVVQKYIERPLLIHDTKFDIRQWFLVSSSYPLIIWMYKICYLRFSSQTYNLRKLHESIHLTNNSVQAKYLNRCTRDPLLPTYGMWNSEQFQNYLCDIGYPNIFGNVIYPGMKQCITAAMIAHRDKIDKRKNCFELYGADFMLSETFEPWLLEINSNPALHGSTPVTARLCPKVLEDVIKVIIDTARNPNASPGNFEMIYKEKPEPPRDIMPKLKLKGKPLPTDFFCDVDMESEPSINTNKIMVQKCIKTPDAGNILLQTGETIKEALKSLLDIIKRERTKRRSRREKSVEAKLELDIPYMHPSKPDLVSLFERPQMEETFSVASEISQIKSEEAQENMTEDESRAVTEAFSESKICSNKKRLLSNLVKVVDTLKRVNKN
ncbi:unnamed protein product [Ceutorhynchus assimilis]|uniref:Tubulin glycylase 3A-like n=1 Tax=Ceutorhynchus assimilis TaxID=467358 RepID=A0A9N9MUX2_9CUCU|nr:unnamed protein product [Ceutorhynchus assimilis]